MESRIQSLNQVLKLFFFAKRWFGIYCAELWQKKNVQDEFFQLVYFFFLNFFSNKYKLVPNSKKDSWPINSLLLYEMQKFYLAVHKIVKAWFQAISIPSCTIPLIHPLYIRKINIQLFTFQYYPLRVPFSSCPWKWAVNAYQLRTSYSFNIFYDFTQLKRSVDLY